MSAKAKFWAVVVGLVIAPAIGLAAYGASCPCGDACPCGSACPCGN